MRATLIVLFLWLGFAGSHLLLSSSLLRPKLVERLGERRFRGLYSLMAFAWFIPLWMTYFRNKHAGPLLWSLPMGPLQRWVIYGCMGVAFVLLVSSLMRPSPAAVLPGDPTPRGVYRITRHPLLMFFAIFGLLHLIPNGYASDVVFFGGFLIFTVLGAWHQDQRKLAGGVPGFRAFYDGTPFLPFTGRHTLQGLRELSPVAVVVGVCLTIVVRYFHGTLFGG